MKLTQKQKAELLQVYETWWDSYLNGDVKTYDSFLEDDFRFIGSTGSEEFLNRKDATAFFEETAEQLAGKAKRENAVITLEEMEGMVLITDLADAYVKSDTEWVYYARFRFTSMMRHTKNGWRFFYQHFSTPDLKAQEGETIGIEKVSAENLELRSAIKRRTAELEIKNRALEIEVALESIRSQATAMKQSTELLDIVVTMRNAFTKLGHRADYFWHMMYLPDKYEKAMTSGDGSQIGMVMELPRDFHSHYKGMSEWEAGDEPVMILPLKVEDAVDYVDKMITLGNFQKVDPNAPTLDDIRHIGGITFIMARTSHGEIGYSLPGVVKNPPEEDLKILERFAGAFDLAHRRFLDLQKAEKQAREVEIELALEKVRSRSIGMRKSEELREVIQVIHDQLIDLNFEIDAAGFTLDYHQNNDWNTWIANKSGSLPSLMHIPYIDHPQFNYYKNAKEEGLDFLANTLSFEDKNSIFKYMFNFMGDYPQAEKDELLSKPGLAISQAFLKNISLWIYNLDAIPYSDEENNTLKRFAKVFEQTYTRFNDLKQAEAQAREAQIEASLERVRARTMAMQQSQELGDVATVLFRELNELVDNLWTCGFVLCEKDRNEDEWWLSTENGFIPAFYLPNLGDATHHNIYNGWINGEEYHTEQLEGDALQEHYDWLMNIPVSKKIFDDMEADGFERPSWQKLHCAYFSYGYLVMITRVPCPEEEIFKRFAKVFDQTYRRFLDLQKAEAQAREAQIEAAMERIRSRSLAMHSSEELMDVITELRRQIDNLGQLDLEASVIHLYTDDEPMFESIAAVRPPGESGEIVLANVFFPVDATEQIKHMIDMYASDISEYTIEFDKEMAEDWHKVLMKHAPTIAERREGFVENRRISEGSEYWNFADFSSGSLLLVTHSEASEDTKEVLRKAAQVFDLAYRRFKDLQKAESQAKEAQIEAALERVRSRSMAMHKSEEIGDVAFVLFEQLKGLGGELWGTGFGFCKVDSDADEFWFANENGIMPHLKIPNTKDPTHKKMYKGWMEDLDSFSLALSGKELKAHYTYMLSVPDVRPIFQEILDSGVQFPEWQKWHAAYFKYGYLLVITTEIYENEDVFKRFAKVFEQAYTRFLDLQKAEEQAREARIEAALEKVRSRTMAMQHSDELLDAASVLFQEVKALGVSQWNCGFNIWEEGDEEFTYYPGSPDGKIIPFTCKIPLNEHPIFKRFEESKKKGEPLYFYEKEGEEQKEHYDYMLSLPGVGDFLRSMMDADFELPSFQVDHLANFAYGNLIFITYEHVPKMHDVFIRFAKVFEQTYTRFLDLQKAEAQAREAEIEAALERVRSKTMAMHNSEDVGHTVISLFDEVMNLGLDKSIRCGIGILEKRKHMETWSANLKPDGEVVLRVGLLNMKIHPMLRGLRKAWDEGKEGYSYDFIGDDVQKYYKALNKEPKYRFNANLEEVPEKEFHKSFFFSSGILFAFSENPFSEETSKVLDRFSDVFGQTYRRYLDLQKAEGQAREAQIEAALEKVRSRTMAMQSSSELVEAANLLFKQVRELGINAWSAGYNVLSDDKTQSKCWMSSEDQLQDPFPLYYTEEASFIEMGDFLRSEEDFFVQELGGEDLVQHYDYMKSLPELKETFENLQKAGLSLPTYQINHLCKFSQGYLLFITYEKVPEAHDIFKRFTKVFDQTYIRFLDLQKAENQTKEAQIELALERVRASTMAMHKSEQLAVTAEVLFEQFDLLGVIPDRISIAIYNEKKRVFELWATDQKGGVVNHNHDFSIDEPTCIAKTYKAWKEGKETFIVDLKGKELKKWIRFVREEAKMEIDESNFEGRRVQHSAFFSEGYLLLSAKLPIKEEAMQILSRFAKVFQQTYTRFLDLQRAELQAREAIKHASVDRVRAEIASMRTATDLKRITPLVWNELKTLDVPFFRCGIMIINENSQKIQFYLSNPDGNPLAAMNLDFDSNTVTRNGVAHWRSQTVYKDHWDKEQFIAFMEKLLEDGHIEMAETYQGGDPPPESLTLQFVPFPQGMLYIGSDDPLTESQIELSQALADAFSVAYSRYEDFKQLESAKAQVENALSELQSAQKQLVQSEKMASLGELTAGIAHEIQNPLNFVNNFSEVSRELIREMQEEMDSGDLEEAAEIGKDIEQNLEKINHHGQRASDIVKGMLQHSRTSNGVSEPTDVNALADEYLRLAYHGLRAKDKSFNVTMETGYDQGIDKLNIIPQDMGRVILNLITNAFYVVNEKKKSGIENYEPTVFVGTKRSKDVVEITIKDNGNGIPKKVLDKIFQPFFTTKPTGQGTGLGLSLSYDIVKAHGGELKVRTKQNEGTEFIIRLPVKANQ